MNSKTITARLYTSSAISSRYMRLFSSTVISIVGLGAIANAFALPTGSTVVSGQAAVSQTSPNQLVVNQGTSSAVINWQSFDILTGESTRFNQPSASSIALNRITSGNPTQILGSLTANGRLMIVNGAGVVFGTGSQVNVAGLVVSAADISNANFNAGVNSGHFVFDQAGRADASIINRGSITATDGGLVALIAPGVQNDGIITANYGTVALGAGKTATLDMYGDNLINFQITQSADRKALAENGTPLAAAIVNNGNISAKEGTVYLTARAARDVVDRAINNTGIIDATASHAEGGTIVLDGGEGAVRVAGTLDASGRQAGQKGGNITVLGDKITIASTARVDASGSAAGGNIKVGGDMHGHGSMQQASTVTVEPSSVIDVSAIDSGDAGTVVIWSTINTEFGGTIFGKGGATAGNGGSAEISSTGTLTIDGTTIVDLHADNGHNGTLLLDPTDIVVDSTLASVDDAILNGGTNVIITTTSAGADTGNITVNAPISWSGAGSLTLNADNNIVVNQNITSATTGGTGNQGALSLVAVNDVNLNSSSITTSRGDVSIQGADVTMTNSSVNAPNSHISILDSGVFSSNNSNVLLGSVVELVQNLPGSIQNAINAVDPNSGSTILTLGNGIWNQFVQISGRNNFTLTGASESGTIIKPDSLAGATLVENGPDWGFQFYAPIVLAQNGNNINISNLTVNGSLVPSIVQLFAGIAYNNAGGTVSNDTMTKSGTYGLFAVDTSSYGQTAHTVNATNISVSGVVRGAGAIGDQLTFNVLDSFLDATGGLMGMSYSKDVQGTFSNNTVLTGSAGGISLHGAHNISIIDGSITGSGSGYGIADDSAFYGVLPVNNVIISGTTISNVATGIIVNGGSNWSITGNTINNASTGINVTDSPGIQFASNTITGDGTNIGVLITGSDNASFNGDTILSSLVGIKLDNDQNTTISGVTLSGNGTGILALDGSGGTLVGNTRFTGGTNGIVLDGAGTSLQFSDALSQFTGQTEYFVLQNSAMVGEVLDASQQSFEGATASSFTSGQLADAESRTIDSHLGDSSVGFVFYRDLNFGPSGPSTLILNQLFTRNDNTVPAAIFSYYGQTSGGKPQIDPYHFRTQDITLSLLGSNAGTGGVGGLANLSPAAGGNASQFAALNPASGDGSGENCSNGLLSSAAPGSNVCGIKQ